MIELYPEAGVPSPFVDGLTAELLLDVVLRGEARKNEATALDAPSRGGLDSYHEKVRAIREELVPSHGWAIDNDKNYCRIVSPDGVHALAIATGTSATGSPDARPETARPMGKATREIVSINDAQCSFFFAERPAIPSRRLTWILLTYRDGDIVRAELSLPDSITDDGVVCRWRKRYLLDSQDLTPSPLTNLGDGDDGGAAPIEVDVALK